MLPSEVSSPANLLTSGNLAAGFLALILAQNGEFGWAACCVGVAAVCDSLDGMLARRTKSECAFGSQLDSLADMVSFGVAPAFIVYSSTLESVEVVGIGACLVFVLCGGWRLARFQMEDRSRYRFAGLSIPPGGVIATVLGALTLPAALTLVIVLLLSLMMVSRLPFPTLAAVGQFALAAKQPPAEPQQATRE